MYHNPVLLNESINALNIKPNGSYVDATFGGGGHTRAILDRLSSTGKLYAFDQDPDAEINLPQDDRLQFIPNNFRFITKFLKYYNSGPIDGILADLGISSHQIDEASRGFSTRFDAPLDMRMNYSGGLTAAEIINQYDELKLRQVLKNYGELYQAAKMARKIIHHRQQNPIETTAELNAILKPFLPPKKANKILAQVYQAIRIEVNQELEALKMFLTQTPNLLNPGGRLAVITYHSLEDRLVKRFIKNGQFEGEPEKDIYGKVSVPLKAVGKFILPTEEEIVSNPRARSAKLRVAQKL
ncbi:MAG: 16S rRNA (cytosine(1402)-N(4))-methyltransferase RsmH [Flavobacteriaceae bacterium]|nr:16S rRNA (cytosine(1402)-N(4))-methyltransferase RsmH [Flavobacteriaceae bacterium]